VTMLAWMPGPWELALIAIIALLLFGRRLPEVGRSLGKGITEFKRGLNDAQNEVTRPVDEPAKPADNLSDEVARLRAEVERLKGNKPSVPPTQN